MAADSTDPPPKRRPDPDELDPTVRRHVAKAKVSARSAREIARGVRERVDGKKAGNGDHGLSPGFQEGDFDDVSEVTRAAVQAASRNRQDSASELSIRAPLGISVRLASVPPWAVVSIVLLLGVVAVLVGALYLFAFR